MFNRRISEVHVEEGVKLLKVVRATAAYAGQATAAKPNEIDLEDENYSLWIFAEDTEGNQYARFIPSKKTVTGWHFWQLFLFSLKMNDIRESFDELLGKTFKAYVYNYEGKPRIWFRTFKDDTPDEVIVEQYLAWMSSPNAVPDDDGLFKPATAKPPVTKHAAEDDVPF